MTRDTYDRFTPHDRGLFGENEESPSRNDNIERTRLTDVTLVLRQDRPAAIMVTQTDTAGERWISLPKFAIEYRKINVTTVEVTLPEKMAREKGLVW
jgi:hypothetical protein